MHEYTVCAWYVALNICHVQVCLEVGGYRAFASVEDDESARTLGVLDVDGWKTHFDKTTHSRVEHMVEVAAKR